MSHLTGSGSTPSAPGSGRQARTRRWVIGAALLVLVMAAAGTVAFVLSRGGGSGALPSRTPGSSTLAGTSSGRSSCADAAAPGFGPNCSRLPVRSLKVMNYYPADAPGIYMWTEYDHARTDRDFAAIAGLGANTVRVIVAPGGVGYPSVSQNGARRLADILDTARAHRLSVQLTLFDAWGSYDEIDQSKQWVRSLLGPYARDRQIVLVELRNEVRLADTTVANWVAAMMPVLKQVLPDVPRTVTVPGSSGVDGIRTLIQTVPADELDVIDVHLYTSWPGTINSIRTAQELAQGRPVIVGETGLATTTTPGSLEAQLRYFRLMSAVSRNLGVPPVAPWILDDFTERGASLGYSAAATYGLRRTDGTWKPAAAEVRAMFDAYDSSNPPTEGQTVPLSGIDVDGNFANEDGDPTDKGRLGSWQVRLGIAQRGGTRATVGRNGSRGGFLVGGQTAETSPPQLLQVDPLLGASSVTVSAWVRRPGRGGVAYVQLDWLDRSANTIGTTRSSRADSPSEDWIQLSVSARPPANAVAFELRLVSTVTDATYFDDVTIY